MPRIGIVSALHDELAAVLQRLPDEQRESVAGRDFWCGHWHGHALVAVLARVGKVAAATTATALIERFGVDRILFTGTAGGLAPGVRVGDVVLARTLLQGKRTRWQQSPFLLTASKSVPEDEESEKKE